MNLALLKIAFPAFWFSQYIRGRRLRWVAVRKNGIDPGLHTMVTDELAELYATLLQDDAATADSRRAEYCRQETTADKAEAPSSGL